MAVLRGGSTFTGVTIPDVSEIDALAATVDGKVVYAATPSGLFRSTNSGMSWSQLKPEIPVSAEVLAISPADSNVVYAGAKSGFYRSTDGGNNWTLIPSPMGQYQTAILYQILPDPLKASTIWVVATNVPNYCGIYLSKDGGSTFTAVTQFDAITAPEVQLDMLSAYSGNGSPYAVAPGQVVLLNGRGFGPAATEGGSVKNGSVTNSIDGMQVTFDGVPAPLLTLQDQSVALVVPFEISSSSTLVEVTRNGELVSNPVSLPVNAISPDVLLVVNQDGTVNSAEHPAPVGSTIAMFVTGLGAENPPVPDGLVATGPSASPPLLVGPHILVGSVEVPAAYVGAAVGLVAGIVQVNRPLPAVSAPGGQVRVQATQFSVQVYVSQ
jgi:uncharacterized protein (TIGR03437 family)